MFEGLRSLSPPGELVLPDAVELPDATYRAQGRPPCAADSQAPFTGTRTPYSLQLAIGLGGETATRAIAEIRRILTAMPEVWDPMFGLLDSFHPDLSGFSTTQPMARRSGRWVQQQVWPLNKGAALLAQLNYLDDGVVWRTAGQHAVIRRGIEKIYAGPEQRRPRIAEAGVALSTGTPVVRRIAPRSLFTVFGSSFAPAGTALTAGGEAGRRLADTCVEVNGARVPMLAVTGGQINAQAPAAMAPGEASIAVIRGCGTAIELASDAVRAAAAARSPAFFSFLNRAGGANPLAAIFADTGALAGDPGLGSELPGAEFRAPEPGDVVTLFGTGFGAVNPAVEDGRPPAGAVAVTGQVRLTLGGVAIPPGDVLYASASPCCAGVDQVNFRIPASAPAGDLRVILTIDGISSPEGPYLTVAAPR